MIWAQEEPRNMGALTFIGPRLRAVVPRKVPLRYVARPERASPAEGKPGDHNRSSNGSCARRWQSHSGEAAKFA